jgi:hypothetical protein
MPSELAEIAARIRQISHGQLAKAENLVDEIEPILLGDAKHKFAAFRLKYSIRGIPIVQSGQVTRSNGFLMTLTVTGSSDQDVAEALRSLNSKLTWTERDVAVH